MLILIVVSALLAVSVVFNLVLTYFYSKHKKFKQKPAYDAVELLHHLSKGTAVIKIEVIDPSSIYLRSPRDMN